ncbi:hypothetical protein Peetri_00149 [Pseudomonas phage vB_PpuM-Peetri]
MIKIAPQPLTRPQYLRRLTTTLSFGLPGLTFAKSPTHAPVSTYLAQGLALPTDELVLLGDNKNSNNVWVLHSILVRQVREDTGDMTDTIIADLNSDYTPTLIEGRYRYFNGKTYRWLKELVRYSLNDLAEEHEVPIVFALPEPGQ